MSMKTRQEYIDVLKSHASELQQRFGITYMRLFGSVAKNVHHEGSDVDVAVVVPRLKGDWLDTSSALWLATMKIDTIIEPVLIEECHPSPLYEDILKTGIAV